MHWNSPKTISFYSSKFENSYDCMRCILNQLSHYWLVASPCLATSSGANALLPNQAWFSVIIVIVRKMEIAISHIDDGKPTGLPRLAQKHTHFSLVRTHANNPINTMLQKQLVNCMSSSLHRRKLTKHTHSLFHNNIMFFSSICSAQSKRVSETTELLLVICGVVFPLCVCFTTTNRPNSICSCIQLSHTIFFPILLCISLDFLLIFVPNNWNIHFQQFLCCYCWLFVSFFGYFWTNRSDDWHRSMHIQLFPNIYEGSAQMTLQQRIIIIDVRKYVEWNLEEK